MAYDCKFERVRFYELLRYSGYISLYRGIYFCEQPLFFATLDVGADFEPCAISAAEILTSNIISIPGSLDENHNEITQAPNAFRAIQWDRSTLSENGGSRLQRTMGRLRLSLFPESDFVGSGFDPFDICIGRPPYIPVRFRTADCAYLPISPFRIPHPRLVTEYPPV